MKKSALSSTLYQSRCKFFRILFCSLFIVVNSFAGITVNSVLTTESRCANDGTVTINATSTPNPFLLFAIVAGPTVSPMQNSPVFYSLYPGTYTARLYDVNFDSLDVQFTIDGDYRSPYLSPVFINPTCPGSTDGQITCNPDTSRGRMPFSYQIISPFVSAPQSSQVFSNLGAGSYDVRMTDSCGNYQTRNVMLNNSGTGLTYYVNNVIYPYIRKLGCDTIEVSFQFQMYKEKRNIPLTLNTTTSLGTVTQQILPIVLDTFNYSPGLFYFVDTLYGLTYGDYLSFQLTDTCGVTMFSTPTTIAPFDFELQYFNTEVNCSVKLGAYFRLKAYPYFPYIPTQFPNPSSFTLVDVNTGLIVDSMSCPDIYCGLVISPQNQGQVFELTITDACGDVWQQIIQWPTLAAPVVYYGNGFGCIDSSAALYVTGVNFLSGITFELLSGPSVVQSTKHGYVYSDSIIYPQVFHFSSFGGTIANLPAGTYQVRTSDSCGFSQVDSFTIAYVATLDYQYYIKRGCLGTNILYFYAQSTSPMAVSCSISAVGGNVLYQRTSIYGLDSINSLPPGAYAIEIYYAHGPTGGQYFDGYATSTLQDCWVLRDTIIIPPIPPTTFISNNTILCNGTAYVQLQVDSLTGVAPFTYEIISGPQVYPQQDSSYFVIPSFGNYVIRVGDACGNSTIQQISVDSAGFPPLIRNGSLCPGNSVTLSGISSVYFTYEWHLPNGTIYTGDSLILNSLSAADTGWYFIYKIVNINGCTDTIFQSYHIGLNDMVTVSAIVCIGDSVQVGNNFYFLPGIYTDTLVNLSGCDSIVNTALSFALPDTLNSSFMICPGDSVLSGNEYYSLPGVYLDTIINVNGCNDILLTTVSVNYLSDSVTVSICTGDTILLGNHSYFTSGIYRDTLNAQSGCDSIVTLNLSVTPLKHDSINRTICQGDTYTVGLNTYSTSGIYHDTLTSASCDSVLTLNLTVAPFKRDSINRTICPGDTYTVGLSTYSTPGIYRDTLATATCDSIVTLNLSVAPFKRDSINRTICTGDTYSIGLSTYSATGIYHDTLATATCDSIVTLNLTVAPFKRDSINRTICTGDTYTVGLNTYSATGIYHDTLTTATCDSIVTLNLTVAPFKRDSINRTICTGDTYTVGLSTYSAPGIYHDTLATATCDSIVTLNLTVAPFKRDSINRTICTGDTYTVGLNTYSTAGIYHDTLATATCDSIVTLNLTVAPFKRDSINRTICTGDTYSVGLSTYSTAGIYHDTLATATCDSIVTLNLTVAPFKRDSINRTICTGDTYSVGLNTYSTSGIYHDTLATTTCDSIVTLNLSVTLAKRDSISKVICPGENVLFGNSIYTLPGYYNDTIATTSCDSIVTLNLIVDTTAWVYITASDTVVVSGAQVQLTANSGQQLNYLWNSIATLNNVSIANPIATIMEASWITVNGIGINGCKISDSVFIDVQEDSVICDDSYLFIPSAFTPNEDGVNDVFNIEGINIVLDKMWIFNRWGQEIFNSNDLRVGWDGKLDGDIMAGIYVYKISYFACGKDEKKYRKGKVYLLK